MVSKSIPCRPKESAIPGTAPIDAMEVVGTPEANGLSSFEPSLLQANLIRHFLCLLELEPDLFKNARAQRGVAGKTAIRQSELERQRLGRELHTGVGQMLAAIRWQLEAIATELPSPSENVRRALANISTLTEQALEQVRDISKGLYPPEWQRLTLESSIRQLWQISGIAGRLAATLDIDPLPSEPDLEVKILLYRAFQEALSNVARHGRATRIDAALRLGDTRLVLTVRDNGVGFNVEELLAAPANVAAGIGLRSIREMAQGLGGEFEVESGPAGTKLTIIVALFPAVAVSPAVSASQQ